MGSSSKLTTPAVLLLATVLSATSLSAAAESPKPTSWPPQFHPILFVNASGSLSLIDLWYDWPNGRNFNIIQDQLVGLLYDVEWNNGSVFKYAKDREYCRSFQIQVGILRPDWLDGAVYLGQQTVDGFLCNVWQKVDFITYYEDVVTKRPVHFLCNVWQKVDFITYYEDVVTKRPVHWVFYTGRSIHVMSFEVGAVLEDIKWQAPAYCFQKSDSTKFDLKSGYQIGAGYLEPPLKTV